VVLAHLLKDATQITGKLLISPPLNHIYSYFLCQVAYNDMYNVGHDHTECPTEVPSSTGSVISSLKPFRSPSLSHKYKPVGLPGSDLPCTLNEIVCNDHKIKCNTYMRKPFSFGSGDSDERCGPWVS
jgi:hypothetical protein